MQRGQPSLDPQPGTVAEMRDLYCAAEARLARIRLLSVSGRELAEADPATIAATLQRSADRIAFFLGKQAARVALGDHSGGIAIFAPGPARRCVASIYIDDIASLDDIGDSEDREASLIHLEMMGATIDRIDRERERGELLLALRDRERRLEHLVGKLFSAQEEERRRVSHELHDGVAQTATALVRILEGSGTAATGAMGAPERSRLAEVARGLVRELRSVIGGLRPTLLDDLGLVAALQTLAEGLEADGYTVTLRSDCNVPRLAVQIETALFRVAQEAIANIRKHAGGPTAVAIDLQLDDAGAQYLRIDDAGQGAVHTAKAIEAPASGQHVGIEVMHERMAAIGGTLEWRALPEGGVTVIARLPKS